MDRPTVAVDRGPAGAPGWRPDPGAVDLVADPGALPVRPGSLGGLRLGGALEHLRPEDVPMALAGAHRALAVGGRLELAVAADGEDGRDGDNGATAPPGATRWRPGALEDLLVGAGFTVEVLDRAPAGAPPPAGRPALGGDGRSPSPPGTARLAVRARRARSLPDTVGPGMRLLVCGLNPSLYAADAGVGFARPGNRFWPAALAAGIVTVDRSPDRALRDHGVGMTDLVKRATVAAAELTADEYRAGLARIERLVRWLRPGALCVVGLAGWRAAADRRARPGVQPGGLGGVPVYVMPSTSGLNARTSLGELTDHLRAAARLADGT
ncbi:MAG TPA: mismatch-specific DNA-glycosylase [Acidimicrobiales bacterium]|nr:mismatch-specific DNA-glycosylase [Acidimicrobiales bacterium]